jgi:hypothetical protein
VNNIIIRKTLTNQEKPEESNTKQATKTIPYLFVFLTLIAYLAVTAFLEEEIAFFDPIYTSLMNDWEYFLTLACSLLLGVFMIYLSIKLFKVKPNYVFIFIAIFLLVIDAVAIFSFPSGHFVSPNDSSIVYTLTTIERIRHFTSWFASLLAIYILLVITPKITIGSKAWDIVFFGLIVFSLVAIVHSYITEHDLYQKILDPSIGFQNSYAPISFANNRNTFGFVLLLGIMSCAYLHSVRHWWWTFFISLFLFANEFFIMSKTVIICSILFYFLYLLWLYVSTLKKHPVRNNIILILSIVLFLSIALCSNAEINPFFASINKFIGRVYFEMTDVGHATFGARIEIWKTIYGFMTSSGNTILWFGAGDHNLEQLLNVVIVEGHSGPLFYAHSAFMDVFGRLGICGFIVYIALLTYGLVIIFKCLKNKQKGSWISLFMFVTLIVQGISETTSFLNMNSKSVIILVMCYVPALTDMHRLKHGNEAETLVKNKIKPDWSIPNVTYVTCFIATLLCGFAIGIIPLLSKVYGTTLLNSYQLISLLVIPLLVPLFIFQSISKIKQGNKQDGSITLIVTGLYLACSIILPIFISNLYLPIALFVIGTALLVVFQIKLNTQKEDVVGFVKRYISSILTLVLMVGVSHICVLYSGINMDTRYIAIVCGTIVLAIYVFLSFAYKESTSTSKCSLNGLFLNDIIEYHYYKSLRDLRS